MAESGHPFSGVFFAGLMITSKGPELIEYNVRFGDPECQVMMMRLKSDLLPLLLATANGTLDQVSAEWSDDPALTVVMIFSSGSLTLRSSRILTTPRAARRSAKGSFEPVGFSPIAQKPISVSSLSASATVIATLSAGTRSDGPCGL